MINVVLHSSSDFHTRQNHDCINLHQRVDLSSLQIWNSKEETGKWGGIRLHIYLENEK